MVSSFLAIVPLFLLIGLGYLARYTLLDIKMLPALNQFVYYFAVPALLFDIARQQALSELLYWPGLLGFLIGILLTLAISLTVSIWLFGVKAVDALALRGLNSSFANYAYMGIPITFSLLGEAAYAATISIVLAGNLILIGGTQLVIEIPRQQGLSMKTVWKILERSLLRSPIFLATVLGLSVAGLNWELPTAFDQSILLLAPAAIPVALFCLGASLNVQATHTHSLEIAWLILVKLLLHPFLTFLAFKLLKIEDHNWLLSAILLTALPVGALVHVVALRYQVFVVESAQLIVLSTLLSILSVTLWATWLL